MPEVSFWRVGVVGAILVVCAACSGAAAPTDPAPTATPAPTITPASTPSVTPPPPSPTPEPPPTPSVFESLRHGYRATVPAGWSVTQYEGTWERLDQFGPGSEVPGEDVIHPATSLSTFVVMNSMEIPAAMSDAEWRAQFDSAVQAGMPQGCSVETTTDTMAGEPATLVTQECPDAVYLGRSLTHAGRGYYFTTRAPLADEGLQATLADIISSISFLP